MEPENKNIPELFGSMVFNETAMREYLSEEAYAALRRTMADGRHLDPEIAGDVAKAMKDWAIERGATHYTHWFQPMTGVTAEKHESFIKPVGDGKIIMEFSGKELIKGEPDASSFPSGGIRSTFEARGYTAWDPSAYAFVKDNTLCIPTVFYAYGGEALDKKTPLLRSIEALNRECLRVLKIFGHDDVRRVHVTLGAEQEYFLIARKKYYARPDLVITGRTLFGAKPPKGQELEDHYFGTIKPRVQEFMADLDQELWKLGILAKTEHNEVAPAQHELAPVYTTINEAVDQNQLTMEIMKKVARRHELACLLHEKPFEGVNGSGKHNNWAISTDTGMNLLEPGDSPWENAQFLLFLVAVIRAVDKYQDLLRVSVAGAGNDHRLGGNEAPPAIISMFLGDELTAILNSIETGESYEHHDRKVMKVGVHILPRFAQDSTDRNRTSPFAFTGNKFEFRSPGSGQSCAGPNVILNTAVADSLGYLADNLEQALAAGTSLEDALGTLIKDVFHKHKRIIFNGNNYSEEWREEAARRGLLELRTTADCMKAYLDPKNVELFTKYKIFSEVELKSRFEISLETYVKTLTVEANTMIDMAYKEILPAVTAYVDELASAALRKKEAGLAPVSCNELDRARELSELADAMYEALRKLSDLMEEVTVLTDIQEEADFFRDKILPAMDSLRSFADACEKLTSEKDWPYPTYSKLLFYV